MAEQLRQMYRWDNPIEVAKIKQLIDEAILLLIGNGDQEMIGRRVRIAQYWINRAN